MTDFILELRCEEIPARMQAGARRDLDNLFRDHMAAAGVSHGEIIVWSTPRRLALIARDLPLATEAVAEEFKGPRTSAPPQALEGFLRKTGLTQDQLEDRDGVWFASVQRPGRTTGDVLAWSIAAIVRVFPWPKSMRWGATSLASDSARWVRPLSGVVAIFGEDPVECLVGEVTSGVTTLGHRFHHPGPITIGGAADYQEKLRACHVIVDHEERQDLIRTGAIKVAAEAGLTLVADEGLVIENAGLTEWPIPLLGRFDEAFLEVPPEVIQLTARTNQKYFVCQNAGGKLANAFVCTANIVASDGGAAIVDGNRKVLAARLSDARFFWEQDRKVSLADHAKKLERITFHEKLGTVADKVDRVAKLARWLVEEGILPGSSPSTRDGEVAARSADGGVGAPPPPFGRSPSPSHVDGEDRATLANLAEQAARLCKADLVTEMVGEFPELQGVMGGYYARAEGLPDAVADAIRDHYKPVGQGDDVPTAPVTVAVSLADKLDTLLVFFAFSEQPTGSKDPFALRRAALAVLVMLESHKIRLKISCLASHPKSLSGLAKIRKGLVRRQVERLFLPSGEFHGHELIGIYDGEFDSFYYQSRDESDEISNHFIIDQRLVDSWYAPRQLTDFIESGAQGLVNFLADRLKVQQREAGVRHDLIDAVFALGGEDDLVRLLARVHALQAFVGTEDGTNLLAGYKRAANILKKEGWDARLPLAGGAGPVSGSPDSPTSNPSREREEAKNVLSYTPEPAEQALIEALYLAGPEAARGVEAEDFQAAMLALASLRGPIDRFFEEVTVNDAEKDKRAARLDLLARFRAAVHNVADFSRIEG